MKKICLTMIVKNEAHCIERCLDSVKDLVDYYWIDDTGSTDNTIEVINKWFEKNKIEDFVVHATGWAGFAESRTACLVCAKSAWKEADYLLMIDADEIIVWKDKKSLQNVQQLKDSLTCDLYDIRTVMAGSVYVRPQLTKANKGFVYEGVVHEFLSDKHDKIETRGIIEEFINKPIQDSARNKDPEKFKKDAEVLAKALENENDRFLRTRYRFYLAQCLRDSGDMAGALYNYQKRAEMGGWEEEVYWSLYQAARIKEHLGCEHEDVIQTYLKAYESAPHRSEALHGAAKCARENKMYQQAYIYSKFALPIQMPQNALFTDSHVYSYALLDEYSIAAFYTGRPKESLEACKILLKEKKFPPEQEERIKRNMQFAVEAMNE